MRLDEIDEWCHKYWRPLADGGQLQQWIEEISAAQKIMEDLNVSMFEGEMKEVMDSIASFRQRMEEEKQKIVQLGQTELHKAFLPFFEKLLKLESLSWRQYTPYFNDGEECVFSVNTDYYAMEYDGKHYDEVHYNRKEFSYERWTGEKVTLPICLQMYNEDGKEEIFFPDTEEIQTLIAAVDSLTDMLNGLGDDLCRAIWGNHVKVFLTRGGFKTEYCDHD